MNFEDEDYVRVYTRKTITFHRLGWEGRTVLWHIMLEATCAGVVELGEGDEIDAIVVLTGLPHDVVSAGYPRLASQGVTERHGTSLVITRFVEAQTAKRSDRARARDYRERTKAQSVTPREDDVTERDGRVTPNHGRHDPSPLSLSLSPSLSLFPPNPPAGGTPAASADGDPAVASPPESTRTRKRRALWHRVPEDWTVKDSHRTLAGELGVDCDREAEKYRDHEFAKGKSDADAAFRTWLRNAAEYRKRSAYTPQRGGPKQPNSGYRLPVE